MSKKRIWSSTLFYMMDKPDFRDLWACRPKYGLLITVRFMVFIPGACSHHQVWIIFVVDGQHTYARTSIQCSACLASCTWYCFCYNILSMSWYISVVSIWAGSVVPAWLFVSACLILKSRPFSTAFRVFMIYLDVNVVALNFLYVQCELLFTSWCGLDDWWVTRLLYTCWRVTPEQN